MCRLFHPRPDEGFRVNLILRRWLNNCKRRIQRRLDKADLRVVTLSAFRVFGVIPPLWGVASPLPGREEWVGEYVCH